MVRKSLPNTQNKAITFLIQYESGNYQRSKGMHI